MLVLSRKSGQAIVIDGGIRITVVAVQGKMVRLGIEAPRSTRVDREEVADRVERDGFWQRRPADLNVFSDPEDVIGFSVPDSLLLPVG